MEIVIFTGLSGSGKSAIAKKCALEFDLPVANLHQILKEKSLQAGFSHTRDWISELGILNSIAETRDTIEGQISQARASHRGIIIDQVIDPETLYSIRSRFPLDHTSVIFVKANRHDRRHWAETRSDTPAEGLALLRLKDTWKYEAGVNEVIAEANIVIENNRPLNEVVQDVRNYISPLIEGDLRSPERK